MKTDGLPDTIYISSATLISGIASFIIFIVYSHIYIFIYFRGTLASQGSISIGSIFGIPIDLHWTFIALILITALLSTYLSLLFILLFVCVLIHELAHSVTSLHNGIGVKRIILLPLGGATIMDETNIDPKIEFNVSLAGPVTSILLGGIFGVLVVFLQPGIIYNVVNFLAEINLLLGAFNLLPAFPLDGGRIFRSYLERKNDYYKATALTVKASTYILAFIVIFTLGYAIFSKASVDYKEFTLLWNLIIVVFLYGGMRSEEASAKIKLEAEGLTLKDATTTNFIIIDKDTSIHRLYGISNANKGSIIATRKNEGIAIISTDYEFPKDAKYVRDVAYVIPKAKYNSSLYDVFSKMENMGSGAVAVMKGNKLIGISTSSLIRSTMYLHLMKKRMEKI